MHRNTRNIRLIALASITSIAALALAGCSLVSTLNQIAAWAKPVATAIDSIVAIVAPGGTKITTDVNGAVTLADDIATDASATALAGAGQSGVAKVITDLTSLQSQLTQIETDLSGVGINLSANDKTYVSDGISIALIAAEGWEAVLQSKQPAAAANAASAGHPIHLAAIRTSDGCAFFDPGNFQPSMQQVGAAQVPGEGSLRLDEIAFRPARIRMNCTGNLADAIDLTINAHGDAVPTAPTNLAAAGKPATAAQFKRQWNAICKKWGHPEKQMKITAAETAAHIFTLGSR